MVLDYEEVRRIHRLEKTTSRLVEVPDDFFYQLHDFIEEERKQYLHSLTDLNNNRAKEFSNIKKLVEEWFSIREKKLMNTVLIATRTNDANEEHMAVQEKKLFRTLFDSMMSHRVLMQHVLEANGNFAQNFPRDKSLEIKSENNSNEIKSRVTLSRESETIISPNASAASSASVSATVSALESMRIRILSDIPSFVGTDMKEYGPYKPQEKIELPTKIAQLFISRKLGELES
mgnify:CR=1 FL=1